MPRADSTIAYPSLTAALPWVPAWDPPALARAIDGGRAGDVQKVTIGWRDVATTGLLADVVDPPPPGASVRAPWTLARIVAAARTNAARRCALPAPAASAIDDTPIEAPLVYPGAPPYTVIADSLTHSAGTSLEPILARIAIAWSLQNFRILSTDSAQPHPTIIAHRDVRDRIALLAPFFAQGRQVEPLLAGDSLYWAVDLYSTSSTYPLSRHIHFAGDDRTYLRHAAVAIVQASTGDISIVPDSTLDPIAVDVGAAASVDLRDVERAAAATERAARAADRRHRRAGDRVRPLWQPRRQRSAAPGADARRRGHEPRDRSAPDRAARGQNDRRRAAAGRRDGPAARTADRHRRIGAPIDVVSAARAGPAMERRCSIACVRSTARAPPRARGRSHPAAFVRSRFEAASGSCSRSIGGGRRPFRR